MDPKLQGLQHYFYLGQMALGGIFLLVGYVFLRPKGPESNFKVREADRNLKFNRVDKDQDNLASAKIRKNEALRLEGIRIDASPYEILGIGRNSTPDDIQKAYRELMKRYHPDRVGRQGSQEWKDAQKIADAIIRAKEALLKSKS